MTDGMREAQLDEWRSQARELWRRMAPRWERGRERLWGPSRIVSEWLVDHVAPRPGETVLDVAAGVGETGFLAAELVAPDGRVITSDATPEMLDAARRRARELGLRNVEFRLLDAERMDLPDQGVDRVLCRWGYMLMADPLSALRETRRVLRDGGRLAFSVWAGPEANPWVTIPGRVMVERGHLPQRDPDEPGMFRLRDAQATRRLVEEAGFGSVEFEPMDLSYDFDSPDDLWEHTSTLQGSVSLALEGLGTDERAAIRTAIESAAEPFRGGGGYSMPGRVLNFVAE